MNDPHVDPAGDEPAGSVPVADVPTGSGLPFGGDLPPLPAGYIWAYPPPPRPPEKQWKAPRWLIYTSVAWGVVLLVLAILYGFRGPATVREQTTITDARPTVDRAVGQVVAAAGSGPVVTISGYQRIDSCKITEARSGADYERVVDLYGAPGTESALMRTIGAGLPASYHASVGSAAALTLYADAGNFVALVGAVPGPGTVEIRALTGCRQDDLVATTAVPDPTATAAVNAAFATLGDTATPATATTLACPGHGTRQTVSAAAPIRPATGSLATALVKLAGDPVLATDNVVAYRSGALDVVARDRGGLVTVSATTTC